MANAAMKTKEVIVVLITLVLLPVANGTRLNWFDISDSTALCNDFTRAGYFLRRVNTSDNWIIYLESGGACYSNETCNRRFFVPEVGSRFNRPSSGPVQFFETYYGNFDPAEAWNETIVSGREAAVDVVSPLMTSMRCFENKTDYFPQGLSVQGTDILDNDCKVNSLFCDYNHVVIPYCSSDLWLGTEVDGVRNNTAAHRECTQCFDYNEENGCFRYNPMSESIQFTYRGRRIFMSVIRDLLAMGMAGATEVVLAGSSAGGLGALNNAKWLQSELQSVGSAELVVIFDSAWLINFQGNIFREFDGTINHSQSEAQIQNMLTLFSILRSNEGCSDVRLGFPCCFSPHCLLTQSNSDGEKYYPEVPTFGIFSLYDVYLLAPSLTGLQTLENEEEISIGYGIDFLLTVGEYGGEMNNTVIKTAAQANFFSYYATQCFQHVYLATSTLWGQPGSSVFGGSSVELQRGLASFRLSVEANIWRSLQLAGPTIQDALMQWYCNRNETIYFRDNCGGPHCNTQCPERFMLTELTSNNWPLGAKVCIMCCVVVLTALCGILKITFCVWKCVKLKAHKTLPKSAGANISKEKQMNRVDHRMYEAEDLEYLARHEGKCKPDAVLSCKNLYYSVEFTSEEKVKDVKHDSVPYRVLDEVIPQKRRTGVSLTIDNISKQLEEVDCLKPGGLGEQLRVPRENLNKIGWIYPVNKARKTRATVEYWLSLDPTPSWRRLVTAVENTVSCECSGPHENSHEHKAMKSMKPYMEPLTDPSLIAKEVFSVLNTLGNWERVCNILCLTSYRKNLIERQHLAMVQRTQAAVKWWLRYSPNASWTWLAGQLYYFEEVEALVAVQCYIQEGSIAGCTPSETELWHTLADVPKMWDDNDRLHQYLQVPPTMQQEICESQQTDDPIEQKKAVFREWLHDHPAPSWAVVAEALYMVEEHDTCKRVKMYIQGVSLTIDNISKQLEEVDCLKPGGLGEQLRVPRNEIKGKYPDNKARQTKATVEYWLSLDPTPSWRRLVTALENVVSCECKSSHEHKAMENVKPCVDPLTDPSLIAKEVSSVLNALGNWKRVCDVLCLTIYMRNLIQKEYSTMAQQTQAAVNWWLRYSPNASWTWLAGQLYCFEEVEALAAVQCYTHKISTAGCTPSETELWHTLADVTKMWDDNDRLCQYLQVPPTMQQEICESQRTDDPLEQKKAALMKWLNYHPAPSWALVAEALYMSGEHDACGQVKMYFRVADVSLTIDNICRQLESVDCFKPGGLAEQLRVPEIGNYPDQARQTRAVVEYWLSVDPTPSWRRLVTALENIISYECSGPHENSHERENSHEHKAMKSMKPYMEPLTDPSLTAEKVSKALEGLKDWKTICDVLDVPENKRDDIQTMTKHVQRQEAVNWWLKFSPNASWNWLVGRLYFFDELEVIESPLQYIHKDTTDSTLTVKEVSKALEDLKDWKTMCVVLGVPDDKKAGIQEMPEHMQRQEVVNRWLKFSPNTSWNWLAGQLYFLKEWTARDAVLQYIHKETADTLNLFNLWGALARGDKWWQHTELCQYLHISESVMKTMKNNTSETIEQQKKQFLKMWRNNHPAPSWAVVKEALFMIGEHDILKQVTKYIAGVFLLTTDNISRQLKEVDCLKRGGLGEQLRVPRNNLDEIKGKYPDNKARQTKATVEYWLSLDPTPSWRRLVTALENIKGSGPRKNSDHEAAINVRPYVEPPTDPSLTAKEVSSTLKTLKDLKTVCDVLDVPENKKDDIQTMTEHLQRQEAMNWWRKFSPNASWNWLAGRLYFFEERTALDAALQYIHKETADTLNLFNLLDALAGVDKWWQDTGLCQYLHISKTDVETIKKATTDPTEQRKQCLNRWLNDHPAPSWAVVKEALFMIGEHDRLKHITGVFLLTTDNITRQLIMKNVDCLKLGKQLRVPRDKLDEIEKYPDKARQTRATVEYWLSVDPKPSWRRLVTALECIVPRDQEAVDCVKPYKEPLSDPSLTAEKVSNALKTLNNWKTMCVVLNVAKYKEAGIQEMPEHMQRQEAVDWWLKFSPNASWNWLAGQLYFHEERTALEAALQYVHKETADTPTLFNLWGALAHGDKWWQHPELCQCLQISERVKKEIKEATSDIIEQMKRFLKRWLNDHPVPSWAVVKEALFIIGEHDILKHIAGVPTIEDYCRQLEKVDCMKDKGLGHQLRVPYDKLCDIRTQYLTQADKTKATIEYWLSVDPTHSWRRLVVALEESHEHEAVERAKLYVEPLTDTTLTTEKVSDVLKTLVWKDVCDVLSVPCSMKKDVGKNHSTDPQWKEEWWVGKSCSTDSQRKEAAIKWWLQCFPSASWTWLAGQLYYCQKTAALSAVLPYISKNTDATLTPTHLLNTLADVTDWWHDNGLRRHLQVPAPNSEAVVKIEEQASDAAQKKNDAQQKISFLKRWLKAHPAPSWAVVKEALYKMEQHDILAQLNVYITGILKKVILDGISTSFKPNVLSAIMGTSGSGKSTFLDLLAGQRDTDPSSSTGEVYIDGNNIIAESEIRKWYITNTGYVQQLASPYYEELTVLENLTFAAEIKISGKKKRLECIHDIMTLTGLHALADRKVGKATGSGLSGGQKRRLLLALQLLTLPKFILLDEPLSGLDSGSAYEVLVSLRKLAHADRIVILTIHRPGPDLFELFDNILLLHEGKIAYDGKAGKVMCNEFVHIVCKHYKVQKSELEKLGATNYDIIQDILGHPQMLELIAEKRPDNYSSTTKQFRCPPTSKSAYNTIFGQFRSLLPSTSIPGQFRRLISRTPDKCSPIRECPSTSARKPDVNNYSPIIAQLRRLAALEARASMGATGLWALYFPLVFFVYGFILGIVYLQETNSLLVLSGFAAYSFASSFVMFPMLNRYYLKALDIFHYEHWGASGWTHDLVIQGFCRAISLAAIPVVISAAVLYLLLINAESYNIFVFWQTVVVNLALNQTWTALNIALMCALTEEAVHISTVIISIAGFTAGFFIPIGQIPWWCRWIIFINPNYYGFSASIFLLLNDFQTDCSGTQFECFTSSGEYVLGQFNLENINPYLHILILFIFTIFFLLLAWFSNWWHYNYTSTRKDKFQRYVRTQKLKLYRFMNHFMKTSYHKLLECCCCCLKCCCCCLNVHKREHSRSDDMNQSDEVSRL